MAENDEDKRCECNGDYEKPDEYNEDDEDEFILEYNEEELDRGIREASSLLGFAGVLNNLGLCKDHIAELIKCKMSCDTDLKIAEISSKMNIKVMENENSKKRNEVV
jgi:hypothetical protein